MVVSKTLFLINSKLWKDLDICQLASQLFNLMLFEIIQIQHWALAQVLKGLEGHWGRFEFNSSDVLLCLYKFKILLAYIFWFIQIHRHALCSLEKDTQQYKIQKHNKKQ